MANPTLIISRKELRDHLTSKKFIIIVSLLILFYLASTSFTRITGLRVEGVGLFRQAFMGLTSNISFIAPLLGIALAYDALSSERERGTLRLLLARPIYRENIVNGKILGGFIAISIAIVTATIISSALTIVLWGAAPILGDLVRLAVFILLSIMFTMCYYSISFFFSSVLRKSSRSAIVSISIWVFFTIILPIIAGLIASSILGPPPAFTPTPRNQTATPGVTISEEVREYYRRYSEISSSINTLSINHHFSTAVNILFYSTPTGLPGQRVELSITDALLRSITNISVMIAFTAVFIILSYVSFTRKEEK